MDDGSVVTLRLLVAVLTTSPIALLLVAASFCLGFLFRGSAKTVLELIPEAALFGWRQHQSIT